MNELSVQTIEVTRNLINRRLKDIENEIEDLLNERDQLEFSLKEIPESKETK